MSLFFFENTDSKSSQSNCSENNAFISPKSQERHPESQKPQSINETPLSAKGNVKSYCRLRPNNTYNSSLDRFTIENYSKTLVVDFNSESNRNILSKQFADKYNLNIVISLRFFGHILRMKKFMKKSVRKMLKNCFLIIKAH